MKITFADSAVVNMCMCLIATEVADFVAWFRAHIESEGSPEAEVVDLDEKGLLVIYQDEFGALYEVSENVATIVVFAPFASHLQTSPRSHLRLV
jgi:hypothetical protein